MCVGPGGRRELCRPGECHLIGTRPFQVSSVRAMWPPGPHCAEDQAELLVLS